MAPNVSNTISKHMDKDCEKIPRQSKDLHNSRKLKKAEFIKQTFIKQTSSFQNVSILKN